jgi:LysR family transcriptional regulator, transcriptional activator of nhaA
MSFFAAPALADTLQGEFPHCLDGAPMLIPGPASSVPRPLRCLAAHHRLHPRVIGEFDDWP